MGEIFWGILRIWVVHATTLMFGDCSTRSTHLKRCGHLGREICVGKGSRRQWKYVLFQQNLCRSLSVSLSSTLLSQLSVCFVLFCLPKKSHQIEYLVQCGPAIALCRMQLFSRPQKQQLHYHMGKREVNQPTPGTALLVCICVLLQWQYYYPSTTAAVHRKIFLFVLIKVHDLIGSFALTRAGQIKNILWWEFFLAHLQWCPMTHEEGK